MCQAQQTLLRSDVRLLLTAEYCAGMQIHPWTGTFNCADMGFINYDFDGAGAKDWVVGLGSAGAYMVIARIASWLLSYRL